jgi:hypothetical protein
MPNRTRRATWTPEQQEAQREYNRQYYGRVAGTLRSNRLESLYGKDPQWLEEERLRQDNRCAICGTLDWGGANNTPNIDHDHTTGELRSLLCFRCNVGLGNFGDSPEILREAAAYLEAHQCKNANQPTTVGQSNLVSEAP